jgi:hypothetical protein
VGGDCVGVGGGLGLVGQLSQCVCIDAEEDEGSQLGQCVYINMQRKMKEENPTHHLSHTA